MKSYLRVRLLAPLAVSAAFPAIGAEQAHVAKDRAAIESILMKGCEAFAAGDIAGAMSPYARDALIFDIAPPYKTDFDHLQQADTQLRAAMAEPPACTYKELEITVVSNDFAYAHYILPYSAKLKSGQSLSIQGRGTDIFRKKHGIWKIVHEHFSVAVDPFSGQAQLTPPN